ncbi:hypothetical protein D3C72_834900 [compost metagenome]
MRRIFICSPYRADTPEGIEANVARTIAACQAVMSVGDYPVAPHLYLTRLLDDADPHQRAIGLELGRLELATCDELYWWQAENAAPGEFSEGQEGDMAAARALRLPIADGADTVALRRAELEGLIGRAAPSPFMRPEDVRQRFERVVIRRWGRIAP